MGICHSEQLRQEYLFYLQSWCATACALIAAQGLRLDCRETSILIFATGQVSNFRDALASLCGHNLILKACEQQWGEMCSEQWSSDSHSFADVVQFLVLFELHRKWHGRSVSAGANAAVAEMRNILLPWVANAIDIFVAANYGSSNPLADAPPPALRVGRSRAYCKVSPEAAWDLLERSYATRTNERQALALRSDNEGLGCNQWLGEHWRNKMLQMYDLRCPQAFGAPGCNHWCLTTDPGTHSYKECLVSIAYSHEFQVGCYPKWQHVLPTKGNLLTPLDVEMESDIKAYAAVGKLERSASYRQLQAYSHQISLTSGGQRSLDDFRLPDACHVRPVAGGERRKTRLINGRQVAFLEDMATEIETQILPDTCVVVPLLVLMLDQGGIGIAGVSFAALHLSRTIWGKFDKIHRMIRDLVLAEQYAWPGALFRKTKLWSAYLYGLNNKPFNSGANSTLKTWLIRLFQICENIDSPLFLKYMDRVSKAFDMPCETRQERQALFNEVLQMKSFVQKGGQHKASNWFSWNKSAEEQMCEFFGSKMVFEAQMPDEPDPDHSGVQFEGGAGSHPQRQLSAILKQGGGINLAYKLMKTALQDHVKILWVAEKACWDEYTNQIKNVKTPKDAVTYSIRMAESWRASPHIWETLRNTLVEPRYLRFMGIPMGESDKASKALQLSWHIAAKQAWSLAKHDVPPETYSNVLSDDVASRARAAQRMRAHHQGVLKLEARRLHDDDADALWKDLPFLQSPAIRMIFEFYARDNFDPSSAAGSRHVTGFIETPPDNKWVEDVHHPLRIDAKGNSNKKMRKCRMQAIIMNSNVLESHGVRQYLLFTKLDPGVAAASSELVGLNFVIELRRVW